MTKKDIVNYVAEKCDLKKKDATTYVDTMFDSIVDCLSGGEDVSIVKFGTFKLLDVEEHTGRNPSTGENITIPAHKRLTFKASALLKDTVK